MPIMSITGAEEVLSIPDGELDKQHKAKKILRTMMREYQRLLNEQLSVDSYLLHVPLVAQLREIAMKVRFIFSEKARDEKLHADILACRVEIIQSLLSGQSIIPKDFFMTVVGEKWKDLDHQTYDKDVVDVVRNLVREGMNLLKRVALRESGQVAE